MHLKINDINKFLNYNCRATWVSKWALDKLLALAKIINSSPEDFLWYEFYEDLERNFKLNEETIKWYDNISTFLQNRVILDNYIGHGELINEIKFIGVIKLQILLLHLGNCEYIGENRNKTVYYNLDDINSINKIFETCLIEDWDIFHETFNKYLENIWSIRFEELDKITGKNISKDIILDDEFDLYVKELKNLSQIKSNSNLKSTFLEFFEIRYKFILIGLEKLLYNKNETLFDESEYKSIR